MVSGIALIKKNMENLIIFFSIQPLLFIFNPPIIFSITSFSSQFHHQTIFDSHSIFLEKSS